MKSSLTIEHGEKTCASEPGKFCRFFGTRRFGTEAVCMLFDNQPLFEGEDGKGFGNGWIQRCAQCQEEFSLKSA